MGRRRKAFLALLLAAVMSASSVTPAFAENTAVTSEASVKAASKLKWKTVSGKKYCYENGKKKTGWLTDDGYRFYLDPKKGGAAATGLQKIDGKQYYFSKSTAKLVVSKYGFKIGSKYYAVSSKGVLKSLSTVEGMAGAQLDKLKGETYSAFKWVSNFVYRDVKVPSGKNPADYLGQHGLKYKNGDCNVQAYTFYWLAKRRGYDAKYVKGYVPQAVDKNGKPKKFGEHAWVELRSGGKTYVCDPSLASEVYIKKGKDPKPAYKFRYGAKGTYRYFDANKKEIKKK